MLTPDQIQEIVDYISTPLIERDWLQGIDLYNKYGDNVNYKVRLFLPHNGYEGNKSFMEYEFRKILKLHNVKDLPGNKFQVPGKASPIAEKKKQAPEEKPEITEQKPETPSIPPSPQGYLRKEFPKISFDNLPDELKILVVDRISLFNQAVEAREKLFAESNTQDENFDAASKTVESMLKNDLIWKELSHFNETGEILGEHPKFKRKVILDKLKLLTREKLFTRMNNIPTYISKAKKAINTSEDGDLRFKKQALIDEYEWELKQIKNLLGI